MWLMSGVLSVDVKKLDGYGAEMVQTANPTAPGMEVLAIKMVSSTYSLGSVPLAQSLRSQTIEAASRRFPESSKRQDAASKNSPDLPPSIGFVISGVVLNLVAP